MNDTPTKELDMENGSSSEECFYEVLEELEELSRYKRDEAQKLVEKFKECRKAAPRV